ncbi:MAG: amidase, partial [Anaerolineae bacterium]|nr:amidase [Anaerolineae bacterium]
MLIESAPLKPIAEALRNGDKDLSAYIDRVCDRLEEVDSQIEAFLPEPGRRERLQHEVVILENRYPDPITRPPLFGIPIGVKDIFDAEG